VEVKGGPLFTKIRYEKSRNRETMKSSSSKGNRLHNRFHEYYSPSFPLKDYLLRRVKYVSVIVKW
jgi:hypothetical protein